jgi:hypothetical protein
LAALHGLEDKGTIGADGDAGLHPTATNIVSIQGQFAVFILEMAEKIGSSPVV